MKITELMAAARRARENAYTPYSHYAVGAALLTADGQVFLGANVENAAYSPTCCAERVALFSAVSAGAREFSAIAVVGGKAGSDPAACTPCGVCRQALREFCDPRVFRICYFDGKEEQITTLADLLPLSFGPENLMEKEE